MNPNTSVDDTIKSIFTTHNETYIVKVLESLRDDSGKRIREDEFSTLVHNARMDGQNDLILGVIKFIKTIQKQYE